MGSRDRHRVSWRTIRPYLAGFGSSGSLLAGAAAVFLIASAIVAFRGWPEISGGPVTSDVAAAPVPVVSHTGARLAEVLSTARPAAGATSVAAPGGRLRGGAGLHGTQSSRTVLGGAGTLAGGAPSTGSAPAGGVGGAQGGAPASACGSSCAGGGAQSGSGVVNSTNTIARTVSTVGSYVGQQITGTSNTGARTLSGVSPPVSSAVQQAGTTAGSAVTGATNAASGAATGATNAASGVAGVTNAAPGVAGATNTASKPVTTVGNAVGGGLGH